jgi:hypothetical protein
VAIFIEVVPDQAIVMASLATGPGTADASMLLPRLQRPLPKPDMKFSLIRLSPGQSTVRIPLRHER